MYKRKLEKIGNLIESIKTDISLPIISDFLEWFYEKIDIHFNNKTPHIKFKKGDIYFVNLGKNIGSELNKVRPCIIYSKKSCNNINSVIIIPLKSIDNKNIIEKFHIIIKKSEFNDLEKDSICDIFHIRNISTKRLKGRIGIIEKEYIEEIDRKVFKLFDLKIKDGK